MVEGAAGGQRGRGDHGGAHALPQMVAQQLTGLHRTGVCAERDQAVAHLRLQPLGQGRLLAHGRFQPAPGGLFHALQTRGQNAQTAVELRQTGRVAGVVSCLGFELCGHALEHLEQGAGVALQRLDPRHPLTRQLALVQSIDHRWRLVVALAALAAARGARHQGRPSWLLRDAHHAHARELALRAFDGLAQLRHVHADGVLNARGHVFDRTRQTVEPLRAHPVHGAGELALGHAAQVVGFVEDDVAVVRRGQSPQAHGGQQQVVVDHDDLRLRQARTGLVVAATVVGGAMARGAGVALGGHRGPPLATGRLGQTVAVTVPMPGVQIGAPALVQSAALLAALAVAIAAGRVD